MIRLLLYPDHPVTDTTCDFALGLGAASVAIASRDEEQEWFSDPALPFWDRIPPVKMVIHLDESIDPELFVRQLSLLCRWDSIPRWLVQEIGAEDWVAKGRKNIKPIQINEAFWIVPTWEKPIDRQAVNLRLDPGLAFGAGSHPTTRLCLEWLTAHCNQNHHVLDYGCGSGILAIAAALLGAQVTATDIDPQALRATADNAALNKVKVQLAKTDKIDGKYGIVVANILANPLVSLAATLTEFLEPDGCLVLSGILTRQSASVTKAYEQWIDFDKEKIMDEWVLLAGRKRDQR